MSSGYWEYSRWMKVRREASSASASCLRLFSGSFLGSSYIPQMVDQMVTERAMALEAERLGLQVSDADVADTIRQMAPGLFPDGKFVGKDAYASMLAQQNMTIDQFEADLKRQVMITRLRDIAMEGTIVTQSEIEAAFRKKNEKIKVEFVRLTADKYKAESQPTTQEMLDFYKAN